MSTLGVMKETDLSTNGRLHQVRDLLQIVSGLEDPQQVQLEFGRRMTVIDKVDSYISISVRGLNPGEYKITRMLLSNEALDVNPVNPWKQWEEIPLHTGGFIGEMIKDPTPKLFSNFYLQGDPVFGDRLAKYGSALVIPLFDSGAALNWSLILRVAPNAFSEHDAEDYLMQGNLIGRMTRNLVIQQQINELNAKLTEQLDEIAAIQRSLLPERLPELPGMSVAASYLTSLQAGGDYYDFFPLDDGRWGMIVADVSGHGAGAATVVAMLSSMIHAYPERHRGPGALLTHLNQQLAAKNISSSFVTAFMGVWAPDDRVLTFSNAGHHYPTRRSFRGEVGQIQGAHDVPLGVLPDVRYEQSEVMLDRGETVVMYTDGITEAFSPPPDREMFGVQRLVQAVRDCTGFPSCVIESIHDRLFQHTKARTRDDDQTIVAMRVEES